MRLVVVLVILKSVLGKLVTPEFRQPVPENVSLPEITQEDLRNAFRYAEDQHRKRMELENKYIASGGRLSPTSITAEVRNLGVAANKSVEQYRNREKFEDVTKYISRKYNLTQAQMRRLRELSLPENEPIVQECLKHRTPEPCDGSAKYRTMDGSCNNLQNPNWGRAFTAGGRIVTPDFTDGIMSPRTSKCGGSLPNPRLISTTISPDVNVTSETTTFMLTSFGQFLFHDITQTITARVGDKNDIFKCCPINSTVPLPTSCVPVEIPKNDILYTVHKQDCLPVIRSIPANVDCKLGYPRHPIQQQNSFIDGSVEYGVSEEEARGLRTLQGGLLRFQETGHGELLPPHPMPEIDACSGTLKNHVCFLAGDARATIQPGVLGFHTLTLREHNRIARIISADYPEKTDEEVFQETRRIVGAQLAHITYKEYVPTVIGPRMMKYFNLSVKEGGYTVYDPTVEPTAKVEANAGAFRFAHSHFENFLSRVGPDGQVLEDVDSRMNQFGIYPEGFYEGKMESFMRGHFYQKNQEYDRFYTDAITSCLRAPHDKFGMDAAVLEVQRGREQGLPSYVAMLNYFFNVTVRSFDDLKITMSDENIRRLKKVYKCFDDVDFFTGALLETPVEDGVVGPLFGGVIGKQMYDLKFGDRFYFEHGGQAGSFTEGQLREIRRTTLAKFVCDNSVGMDLITSNTFRPIGPENKLKSCKDMLAANFTKWFDK